jgi:hypothetical protein
MTKRTTLGLPANPSLIDQKIAARQARLLQALRKATLAELSPDPAFRAAATAAFQAVLDADPGE